MCQSIQTPDMEFIKPGAEVKLSWKVLFLTTRQIHTDHWLSKGIHQGRRGQRLSLAWNLQRVGSDSEEVASISVLLPALASEKSTELVIRHRMEKNGKHLKLESGKGVAKTGKLFDFASSHFSPTVVPFQGGAAKPQKDFPFAS